MHEIAFYGIPLGLNSNVVENRRDEVRNKEVDDHEGLRRNDDQSSGDDFRHPDEEVEPCGDEVLPINKIIPPSLTRKLTHYKPSPGGFAELTQPTEG